ncbi:MAG: thiamine pyrophosphate-dependent dehydrogenase E1 component subunit alpha [Bacteroidetes bacterium]|nr:thiamine pyrophosphate-dependent dehydrogenase E1 component subunit alpha [Bacteroidota bacterium]MCW5897192.1 thiamine pyrophosphate-dependent dehydrogenase E1 component subunit alpha [Bacteroidota bacterium]
MRNYSQTADLKLTDTKSLLSNQDRLELFRYLLLTREVDNAIIKLYKQGKMVGGAFTGYGNEATAVGSAFALEEHDYLFPMHRDLGAHLVKGQTLRNIFLMQLGRGEGLARGRDGTGHYADPSKKIYGNVSHLAAMIPMACGVALASKMRKENAVVMNYIGDGGCNVGEFHEGMNMAAVMKLPFVMIIENNQFAYSTPNHKQFAAKKLSDRAIGYGIPGFTIDGTDVERVYEVCKEAVERARKGDGPTLIETITMRMHGHSLSDDASYVPRGMVDEWKKKDPIVLYEEKLMSQNILSESLKNEMHEKILAEIQEAVDYAVAQPYPVGEWAGEGVYTK